ncbi:MAG TPA: amino acid permease [Candidatus Hydrogenedentes bacterium]|mgnify:CR=1 FL=1|nr:amino acid permease [Candidatus Hydrogenedentota bacterium]HPG66854.1 amino acid permease [Candidatus Hydrogenedentota bacterium]
MELKKGLGLIHVFCIASGAMISSGIFVLPGLAYDMTGPAVIVSYLLAGILAATGLLSTAELATAMPKAGSDYFFITRAVGPACGTIAGVLNWVSFSLKSAFALVGMAAVIQMILPIDIRISGVVLGAALVAVNLVGVKEAARLQVALVAGLLGLMVVYVIYGLPAASLGRFEPFAPKGTAAVFSTAGLVFVAYGGLLKVASVAEEVRSPGRTIPLGMILSLVLIGLCYLLMITATIGIVDPEVLRNTLTPITDGAHIVMGPVGKTAISVAASLAFLTTANTGILAGSRYLLALSRDGMLPASVGHVNSRFHTPHVAILATGCCVILPLFVDLYILVESASIGLILTNVFALVSVIILRESRLQNYRPVFRAPLYPWLQIAGLVGFGFVLLEMREEAFVISALLALAGFCLYWFYGRSRVQGQSAFLHLLERLTAREMVDGTLEAELKEIVRERDEITLDRFDRMVEQCPVLDLNEAVTREEFFTRASEALGPRLGVPEETIRRLLSAREQLSSTVLAPHLAIPHIVVEASKPFEMLIARCRPGVRFRADAAEVHTVIALAGPIRERNFHLRCLAAVAQIVQAEDFEARWLSATGEQALRDLLLLSPRPRA